MQPVQGDLAHFLLADVDVAFQQVLGLFGATLQDRIEDLPVLGIRRIDARRVSEIQTADDANLFSDFEVHTRHFPIAGGLDQGAVESLVQCGHAYALLQAFGFGHQPGAFQFSNHRMGIDIQVVGTILMVVGVVGFAISLYFILTARSRGEVPPM